MAILRGFFVTDTKIDDITLDVATVVDHSFSAEVTTHPVSEGEDISDHVTPQADVITVTGIISRTPINPALISTPIIASGQVTNSRYQTAFDKLRDLKERPRLITLLTQRRQYDNMVLTSINITDDAGTGDSIQFTATFQHIRQVQVLVTRFSDAAQRPKTIPAVKRLAQQSPTTLPDGTNLGGLVPIQ